MDIHGDILRVVSGSRWGSSQGNFVQTWDISDPDEPSLIDTASFGFPNDDLFATLFLGILDTSSHSLIYSIGGHEHPYLLRSDGTHLRLQAGGLPLGMLDGMEYQQESIALKPGDCLFVYSDGVTDNVNADFEPFGEERLEKVLASVFSEKLQPDAFIDNIFSSSMGHGGKTELFDDMTAVVLIRYD